MNRDTVRASVIVPSSPRPGGWGDAVVPGDTDVVVDVDDAAGTEVVVVDGPAVESAHADAMRASASREVVMRRGIVTITSSIGGTDGSETAEG
jgi:hypothetical protein